MILMTTFLNQLMYRTMISFASLLMTTNINIEDKTNA